MTLKGQISPGFEAVSEAFLEGFASGREVGGALAVYQAGEPLIDIWAGQTDRRKSVDWQADTLVCCFSISKAITALVVAQAVDEGLIDLDKAVSHYWPEYQGYGKEHTTVRHLFAHQAGLPGLKQPLVKDDLYDWHGFCATLAAAEPWWQPGSAHGYHARTFGFLLGEVLRRATGQTVAERLRQKVTGPLACEFYFELSDEQMGRCADMIPAKIKPGAQAHWSDAMKAMAADFTNPETVTGAAFQNPVMGPGYMNTDAFRQALIPAVNGHGTARALAEIMSKLPSLLSKEMLAEVATTQAHGPDEVLKSVTRFGLGFMLDEAQSPIGWPGCMGHAGAGGSIAFYDPASEIGFAYVMNQMQDGVVTGGTTALECIEVLRGLL